ncbi:MAG: hypothetical protein ABEJ65_05195 [bacterium]
MLFDKRVLKALAKVVGGIILSIALLFVWLGGNGLLYATYLNQQEPLTHNRIKPEGQRLKIEKFPGKTKSDTESYAGEPALKKLQSFLEKKTYPTWNPLNIYRYTNATSKQSYDLVMIYQVRDQFDYGGYYYKDQFTIYQDEGMMHVKYESDEIPPKHILVSTAGPDALIEKIKPHLKPEEKLDIQVDTPTSSKKESNDGKGNQGDDSDWGDSRTVTGQPPESFHRVKLEKFNVSLAIPGDWEKISPSRVEGPRRYDSDFCEVSSGFQGGVSNQGVTGKLMNSSDTDVPLKIAFMVKNTNMMSEYPSYHDYEKRMQKYPDFKAVRWRFGYSMSPRNNPVRDNSIGVDAYGQLFRSGDKLAVLICGTPGKRNREILTDILDTLKIVQ